MQAVRLSPEELARRQAARPSIVPQVAPAPAAQAVRTPTTAASATQQQINARVNDIAARSAQTQQNAAAARGAGFPTARGIEVAEQAAPKPQVAIQRPAPIPAANAGPARFPTAAGIEVSEGAAQTAKAQRALNSITSFGNKVVNSGAARFATSAATKVGGAIAKSAPVAAAVGGIAGAAEGLNTDTQDYYRRLGVDPPSNDGLLALGKDIGVRTLGVLSDVGAATAKGITFGAYDPSENFADKRIAKATAAAQQAAASSSPPIAKEPSVAQPKPDELPGQTPVPTTTKDTGVPDIKAVEPTTPTPNGRKVYTNQPDSEETKQLASGRNLISIVPSAAAAAGAAGAGSNPAGQPGTAGGRARGGGGIDREAQLRDWRDRDLIDTTKKMAAERNKELSRLVGASEAALAKGKRKTAAIYANLAGNYSGQGGGVDLSGFARAGQAGQTEAQRMADEANARAAEAQATQAELATAQQQRVAALMDQYNSAQDDASRSKIADQIQALTGSKTKPSVVDIATGETDLEGRPVTVKGLADSNGNIIYSPIQPKKQQ